jgi:hypothetical protein
MPEIFFELPETDIRTAGNCSWQNCRKQILEQPETVFRTAGNQY